MSQPSTEGVTIWAPETVTVQIPGPQGPAGPSIELRETSTHIQWRVVGDEAWINLVALSELQGDPGPSGPPGAQGLRGYSVELRVIGTQVQWKSTNPTSDWQLLFETSEFGGPEGPPGEDGTSIIYGEVEPTDGIGMEGDSYLYRSPDGTIARLYAARDADGWDLGNYTNLITELALAYGNRTITVNTTGISVTAAADGTLATNSQYTQITGIWDPVTGAELVENITLQTNAVQIDMSGVYNMALWGTANIGASGTIVGVKLGLNGEVVSPRRVRIRSVNTNDIRSFSANAIQRFEAGDIITVWHAATSSTTIVWEDMSLTLHRISD